MLIKVTGMTCGGCAAAVTRAIKAATGAAAVTVDLASGSVEIAAPVDPAAVEKAVKRAGFGIAAPAG